ncbi:MAG: sarcosine oxidase subunit gamma [Paracoccaceae bacterium]
MVRLALKPLNALGGKDLERSSFNGIEITEKHLNSLASIGCSGPLLKNFSKKLKSIFDIQVPGPGKSTASQKVRVSWTAQGQWFIESHQVFSQGFDIYLIKKLGKEFAVADQSDGWVRFSLSGDNVLKALEKCIMLDLYKMSAGSFSRCSLEHIGVYLLCKRASKDFLIYGPRSSAKSLHHALIQASISV